jgi:Domain of unknown function (DUF4274)
VLIGRALRALVSELIRIADIAWGAPLNGRNGSNAGIAGDVPAGTKRLVFTCSSPGCNGIFICWRDSTVVFESGEGQSVTAYSSWINWFRDVSPKLNTFPAKAIVAPGIDAQRIERALNRGHARLAARDFGILAAQSPAMRMINWLKTQPACVVDAAALNLNWDRAEEVIIWLLDQSTTDAATAIKLFMRTAPSYYVSRKAQDLAYEASVYTETAIQSFAANWTANRYSQGGVAYDPSEITPFGSSDIFYINELNDLLEKQRSNGVHILPNLSGLEGPFNGDKPKDIDVFLKEKGKSEYFLVRFLFAGLGTWIVDDKIDENDFDNWMRENNLMD